MPLTLSQFENHLWKSANILRSPVDDELYKIHSKSSPTGEAAEWRR
jgi:hypothetical protein